MSEIIEYSPTVAALAALAHKYENVVFDVTNVQGMDAAKKARADIKGYRVDLEKLRKEIKAPALARCNGIDAEARRITAELSALEDPIDLQIKTEEARKEAIRAAKAQEEADRIAIIQARITSVREELVKATGRSSEYIAERLNDLRDLAPDAESFAEFLPEALSAHESSMAALGDLLDRQMAAEDEAAKVAAERAELARMREADEVRVREQAAKEAEATKLLEAEQAASRKRIEDAERESRLKIEEQERAARAIHDAAEAKEREAQRAIEEQQRIERDKADAVRRDEEQKAFEAERERLRLIAEAHDASALLSSFKERFGHMKQYAGVVKAINAAEAKA